MPHVVTRSSGPVHRAALLLLFLAPLRCLCATQENFAIFQDDWTVFEKRLLVETRDRITKDIIRDAEVQIMFPGQKESAATKRTDENGRAYFAPPPGETGEFDIYCTAPGYDLPDPPVRVRVDPGKPGVACRLKMRSSSEKRDIVEFMLRKGASRDGVVTVTFSNTKFGMTPGEIASIIEKEEKEIDYRAAGYTLADSHTIVKPPDAAWPGYDIGENVPTGDTICGGMTLGYLLGGSYRTPSPVMWKIIKTLGEPVSDLQEGDVAIWGAEKNYGSKHR